MNVTHEAIRTLVGMASASANPAFQPIVQVISIKPVTNTSGQTRYRAVLSDGQHFVQGMLATQLNQLVESDQLQPNALIEVQDFMNNLVQGRSVIILLKIDVLPHQGVMARIGNPTDVEKVGNERLQTATTSSGPPPPTAAPMYNRTNNPNTGPPYTYTTTSTGSAGANSPTKTSNPYSPQSKTTHRSNLVTPHDNPYGARSMPPIIHRGMGMSSGMAAAPQSSSSPSSTTASASITPISQLNLYQNRWTIQARVVTKSPIRTWSNAKGEGSLFSLDLLDHSGTDIRATLFKEAVDKYYSLFAVGQVYRISGGRLKVANAQYNTCKSPLELTLDCNSEVHLAEDDGNIQDQSFDFVKVAALETVEAGKSVDVIGIVQEVGEVVSLLSKKTGQELQKCDVTIVDDSAAQVRITLWGTVALEAKTNIPVSRVCAFKRARVSDYGGKSLSGPNGTFLEPKVPETQALQTWWTHQGGASVAVKSLSTGGPGGAAGRMDPFPNRKDIAGIKTENMGYNNEKGDYLTFKAHISFLKKDKEGGAWYTACPNTEEPCRNRCKVTQTTDGNWLCDRCQITYPNCNRKWIFSGTVVDDTSTTWVSFFDDQAVPLLGGCHSR